jgi:Glycosyltransferase like family
MAPRAIMRQSTSRLATESGTSGARLRRSFVAADTSEASVEGSRRYFPAPMIAFGCAITDPGIYERYARPGIELAREADSPLLAQGTAGSIFRNYNLIIDRALELPDLEALVIVHQDAEIVDPDACAKVRAALSDPDVGLVGCAGAIGVRSIAWWEGSVTWAAFTHRYEELGGGEIPSLTWVDRESPSYARLGEVDAVDGFVLGLSPRALRELRFDESLGRFHGYDYDICMQARSRGMKVVTADIRTIHHHSLELINDPDAWIGAHMRLAEKWAGEFPDDGGGSDDWRARARRAEAEAGVARLLGGRERLLRDATAARDERRIEAAERQLEEIKGSLSWRLTAPLRRLREAWRRS